MSSITHGPQTPLLDGDSRMRHASGTFLYTPPRKHPTDKDPDRLSARARIVSPVFLNAVGSNDSRRATREDPTYAMAHVNLGLLLGQQNNSMGAQREFQMAIQVDPGYGPAYSALGLLQAKTGHGADAIKSFQRAVELEPASADSHLNLGIALVDQFDRPAGFKEFSEALRLDPNLAAAHYNLGRFFFSNRQVR